MAGETSGPGPSEQEIRMVALERKFDELLSFVQLIGKRNSDDENQRKEDDKDTNNFSSMSWFPNMTVPPKFKAPEFEKYNGRGDPMIHLQMYCRKMAPYADNEPLLIQTFQDTPDRECSRMYGFNSQIAPDRFDLQRMEKKSNETFREYAQRWREKAARARPPLDEREMIKIFVDTLKNPYFDRMIGLQMQFFVDLILVGERIEDALKTKKIVDMTALMALAEQAAKKAPTKKREGDVQMIGRNNGKTKASPPDFHHATDTTQAYSGAGSDSSPSSSPDTPGAGEAEKSLISPVVPRPYNGPQRRDFNPNSTCDFHFGEVGHTVGKLQPTEASEGGVNMVEIEEMGEERISWRRDACEYPLGGKRTQPRVLREFKKKVTDLMEKGLVGKEEIPSGRDCQSYDPSDLDWYAELNLDDIVEDEMDLDSLQDEGDEWGYFMEDDTDEWRNIDFTKLFRFPCLIVPPGACQNKQPPGSITPFLPTGFSRVSVRKTGQPDRAGSDVRHIKYSQEEGPGHISQPIWEATFAQRFSPTRCNLVREPRPLGKRFTSAATTQLSDRQELLRSSRNLSQKMTPWHKEHSNGLCSQDHILRTQARLCARPVPLKSRQRKLSDGTKNVKIRHRELGQICARTGTRFEKKRAGSKTHFFSRTAAFARRVFPARNKLIREPGCVGKIMTPATTWNSRFADSIPRLIGIFIGKVHKNSSDTPTSGSHNSLVRTPIRANFISLERGRRELSEDMPHDPF
uniref:Retrotransposon gag domain-containing protein n=1 Tax=Fagus sylvatica TaxID=28930 RepID=A0A2N9HUN9_FAGSY